MANLNLKNLSMLDVAEYVLKENKEPLTINDLFQKVAEIKGVELTNFDLLNQFYTDMVSSGKFVYCDNDFWDLKENNLEFWDKESYSFTDLDTDTDDDLEDIDFTEFILPEDFDEIELSGKEAAAIDDDEEDEDLDDIIDEDIEEEDEYIEVELPMDSIDDDDMDESEIEFDDDFDEDNYDDIMDEFEDMYDE